MENLKKILFLDKNLKEIDSIPGVTSYTPELDIVSFTSEVFGDGHIGGIQGYYIVVPESFEYEECIKELDVVEFYRGFFIKKLSEECGEAIENGFTYNNDTFSYDTRSQSNFNEQLMLLTIDDEEDEIEWKVKNGDFKTYSRIEFIKICKAGKNHKNYYRKKLNEIKSKVYDFKKVKDLFSIASFTEEVEKLKS